MTTSDSPDTPMAQIAQALVDFSVHGSFPEDKVSALKIDADALPAAIKALADAKAKLQAEVHAINEETAGDVRAWQANAQVVQDDILRSKALASEIIKASEAPAVSGRSIRDAEARADFLVRELNYNAQVQDALRGIKTINRTLDEVELARDERRILDALHLLERSWKELDMLAVSKSCRAVKLLDIRAFELKSDVHEVFDHVWNALVSVDVENQRVSICGTREDEPMSLEDAVIGLKAYKEVDQRMSRFCHDLNQAVLLPRMDIAREALPAIHIQDDTLEARGSAHNSIKSLFTDLEKVFSFLVQKLPPDLVKSISSALLPETIHRVTTVWLDSAVPSSLRDMEQFQAVIANAKDFCASLKALGLTNLGDLREWTENAPRVWLAKCREAALDSIRTKLSQGLGAPTRVEKVEKQMVSQAEGEQLVANGTTASADDHGWDAWDDGDQAVPEPAADSGADKPPDDGEDDGTDAWGWGDDEVSAEQPKEEPKEEPQASQLDEEDDPSAAWGWGDETNDVEAEPPTQSQPAKQLEPQTRELILKETYSISSLPQPVLDLISAIVEDGAALTNDSYAGSPVAAAAAGLFSLPTLALAMFRAVSPYYYAPGIAGNMYLYNDATYLAERLADFADAWKMRDDISTRARNMLRLDNDIKSLQRFAARAYTNELSIQKTVLRDLLGGEQNLLHHHSSTSSSTSPSNNNTSAVAAAISQLTTLASAWEPVLARSVWQQAVGALADAVATKLVADVMDLPSIGQDEAYSIASTIAQVAEAVDGLFLVSRWEDGGSKKKEGGGKGEGEEGKGEEEEEEEEEVPVTAQFAPGSWLRLKYLSEVLQSNLRDVRFLWFEGELSLYFGVEEVVDLIGVSFEDNARTREVVREIRGNPRPRGV